MRSMQIDRLALSFCHGSEGKSCREELRDFILPEEEADICKRGGGGGGGQRTLCNHRDIQWTPLLRRVKYNQTNTPLFSLTPWDLLLRSHWKSRKRKKTTIRQAPSFPIMAYLSILIGCFMDDNYLLEYRIAERAPE